MPLRRLDDDGRAIIALANGVAHDYGLEYVGTEHILIAIMRHEANPGARALARLGITEQQVRHALEQGYQAAKEDTWVFGRLPGSPHYRNVIERAMEVAEQLESQQIGAAHLLLALYGEVDSTAKQTLAQLGVTHDKCRDEVLRELSAA